MIAESASSPPAVAGRHALDAFDGAAGARIAYRCWLPEGEPRAVVVISHGICEHGGRYRYLVEALLPDGFAVYAVDHRGHGHSTGRRAQIGRMSQVVEDLDALVVRAHAAHPRAKLFLLGHSMGGCVAIVHALRHPERLDGLILSSPLAGVAAAPRSRRALARALSVLTPNAGVLDIDASTISRDPVEVRAYEEDPLVFRGRLPARTVQELADTVLRLPISLPDLTLPLLTLLGDRDDLVPPTGGLMVHDRAGATDKTLHVYEGFFHELFNEPAGERERPLRDVLAWLCARTAPAASPAARPPALA